jgi:hypothetical protein
MKFNWLVAVLLGLCGIAQAEFVTIGNAGNAADTNGYGAVGYSYKISATEVTIAEFQASGAGNGNENYWNDGTRTVGTTAPASMVSLYEAMKYCNYLTSGDVTLGAYQFSGETYTGTDRALAVTTYGTVYALPTENEWYKAAFFKTDASGYSLYANGTDTAPAEGTDANYNMAVGSAWAGGTGTTEQNGTFDMAGNVWEWLENSSGAINGGSFFSLNFELRPLKGIPLQLFDQSNDVGFRIVEVDVIPEPATAMLLAIGGCIVWLARLRQRS